MNRRGPTALQGIVHRIGTAADHSGNFAASVRKQHQRLVDRESDARATRESAERDAQNVARALAGLAELVERVQAMRQGSERSRDGMERTTAALRSMDLGFAELRRLGASFRT